MVKAIRYVLSILLVSLTLLHCKTKKKIQPGATSSVQIKAQEIYQSGYEIIDNKEQTFALVRKEVKARPNQLYPTVHFFVYQYETSEDFYHQTLHQGSVEWVSNEVLSCTSIPGRVKGGEGKKKYLYNVITRSTKPSKK